MKWNPWIFPGLAVLIVGGWIGYQKNTAASLLRDISILTERIRHVQASEENQLKSRKAEEKAKQDKEKKINWKDLASKMVPKIGQIRNDTVPKMRAMWRIQSMLMEMSPGELAAQLDEIAKLDLDEESRSNFEFMILGVLAEKDPKLALDRCADQLGGEERWWTLAHAFGKWAGKEPVAAAACFDQL